MDTSRETPEQVWLDVDTGVDDAQALLLALRSPRLKVLGVSCVVGNSDVDTVVAATLKVQMRAGTYQPRMLRSTAPLFR